MFYEVEMISEFVESVYQAAHQVDNKDNITVIARSNSNENKIEVKKTTPLAILVSFA